MRNLIFSIMTATGIVAGATNTVLADDEKATITTVWVNGHGQSSMADKVNKTHAQMAAAGWRFADLDIYDENGDMQGFFVTYVRDPAPPSSTAK